MQCDNVPQLGMAEIWQRLSKVPCTCGPARPHRWQLSSQWRPRPRSLQQPEVQSRGSTSNGHVGVRLLANLAEVLHLHGCWREYHSSGSVLHYTRRPVLGSGGVGPSVSIHPTPPTPTHTHTHLSGRPGLHPRRCTPPRRSGSQSRRSGSGSTTDQRQRRRDSQACTVQSTCRCVCAKKGASGAQACEQVGAFWGKDVPFPTCIEWARPVLFFNMLQH